MTAARTITVELNADSSQFVAAMKLAGEKIRMLPSRLRMANDREYIRRVAAREKAIALHALDVHVQGIYDDLGLVRDPNIIRGEQ